MPSGRAKTLFFVVMLSVACGREPASGPTPSPTPTPGSGVCISTVSDGPAGAVVAGGADFMISITTTAGCSWTAASAAPFITIVGGSSGTGSGTVRFTVQPNTGEARQGTVQVAGRTITVAQSAAPAPSSCQFGVSPAQVSLTAPGGTVSVSVAINSGTDCSWTATTSASFIAITQGTSGSGPGTVQLTVAQNAGAARTGSAVVAGITVSVLQEAGQAPPIPCDFNVFPGSITAPAAGASTIVNVQLTQGFGCAWIAQTQASFISMPGISAGTGSGSFTITVAPNSGAARSGTVIVGGRIIAVDQAAAAASNGRLAAAPGSN